MTSTFIKLQYPVYSAAFDPYNHDFLFVGGGGGEGRSGIPNKITLLDTSAHDKTREVAQIDLSREEDSVQSIAVAHPGDNSAILYAGINSSQADQDAGKNEHLRAVEVPYPPRTTERPQEAAPPRALSKAALFTQTPGPKKETYQKVLRLSPARADITTRLGAIATRDAPSGEIVLFDASKPTPAPTDVLHRVQLGKEEAGDIDIIEAKDEGYLVAYCTDANINLIEIPPNGKLRETQVFTGSKRDGSFRSLRFLDRNHILMVRNLPKKSGAQMLVLYVPSQVDVGTIVYGKGLHRGFNAALALDVARLPALDGAPVRQYIAGIAGQDGSLVVFTINQAPGAKRQMSVKQHSLLRDLHPAGITSLAFSQFKIPYSGTATKPLRLRLASTSFANTVVVHTFALRSQPNPRQATHQVLATPPQRTATDSAISLTTGALMVALVAIFMQMFHELQGNARHELFHVRTWAPLEIKYLFDIPADPRDMGVPEHQWESHPAISSIMPSLDPASSARAQSIADRISASKKSVRDAAAAATTTVDAAISEASANIKDAASEIPSAEEAKQKLSDAAEISSLEEITEHIANAAATTAADAAISEAIASMKDAASEIPSAEEVKQKLSDAAEIPSLEEITQHIAEALPKGAQAGKQKVMKAPSEAEKQSKQAFKKIRSILHAHHRKDDQPADKPVPGAVMFQDSEHGLKLSTHEHADHLEGSEAKKWEDLSKQEQHLWQKRLTEAGHWAEGETEKILKGVFFGTVAGMVGAAVG